MDRQEFFELLCCPDCKGELRHRDRDSELYCYKCDFTFPIIDSIPVMFPCNVKASMKDLFGRYWDSEEKAELYDSRVEGRGNIFGVYNHLSEVQGLTVYYDLGKMDIVLDAGCGNGRFLETFPKGTVAIGVDASLNLLKHAQKRGRGDFHVCCELEHLPFREGQFSTVITCRVLQHLRAQERAVQELCRVTGNRGDLILQLYNAWNLKTVYKNIRMSKVRKIFNAPFKLLFRSLSPFEEWGLSYDKYNSWFQVKRWLVKNNMHAIMGRGVGFGYHKYLFDPFYINAILDRTFPNVLKAYYDKCLTVEKIIGGINPLKYMMEKFVIRATKNAPELNRGLVAKVIGRGDDYLKSSWLWNLQAIREATRERRGQGVIIRENRYHIMEAIEWMKRAQDATPDDGVSRGYSVGWNPFFRSYGWQPSYPETTGYIIPTFFDCSTYLQDGDLRRRAIAMADWEIEVQMANGAVMGGTVNTTPLPAVFNTGQVIFGWLRTFEETQDKKYLAACERAAQFLLSVQNEDGGWNKGNSRFANVKTTTYNSRVGWALVLLGQTLNASRFLIAGEKNIEYTLRQQNPNGWFRNNCLDNPEAALLHTICYAIEGVWGAAEALRNDRYYERANLPADHLLLCLSDDGRLPGRLDSSWKGVVDWDCLTGNAQLAGIWLKVFAKTGDHKYQTAARKVLGFLTSAQNCVSRNPGLRGGIKGSFPFDGAYGRYEILNWATKFFIDALLLDERLSKDTGSLKPGSRADVSLVAENP